MMPAPCRFSDSVVDCTPAPNVINVLPTLSSVPWPTEPALMLNVRFAFWIVEAAVPFRVRLCVVLVSLAEFMPTSTLARVPVAVPVPLRLKLVPELVP